MASIDNLERRTQGVEWMETVKNIDSEFEEGGGSEEWEDWMDGEEGEGDSSSSSVVCLFCVSKYTSCDMLFEHCRQFHHFDFQAIRNALGLDFYGSFKLINYIRTQVESSRCWSCGHAFPSTQDLLNHLHENGNLGDIKILLEDDKYLKPFMADDVLLYSFGECEGGEDECNTSVENEELMRELKLSYSRIEDECTGESMASRSSFMDCNGKNEADFVCNDDLETGSSLKKVIPQYGDRKTNGGLSDAKTKDAQCRGSFLNHVANDIKNINESYFGAYSSYGIHREMLSDKVRMNSYREAILENPSLLKGAVVMDLGCGTGVLSLFAAQAGASRVIAVEASEKMAAVATQIAKENGFCHSQDKDNNQGTRIVEVVHSMAENLDKAIQIQPHSIDVLVSEWMGYCLLYESMLPSVLSARDRWLNPGGAILPDTATIFVAGFGIGGTSIPFWENVYGLNMSHIGKELVQDAAKLPIVGVVDEHDLVTPPAVLQSFDLATMKPEEVDFTASVELESKGDKSGITQCYGIALWFDTGFTIRFCKEKPAVLSTSPYTPKTHWSQTILTFHEPVALAIGNQITANVSSTVGTDDCPAEKICLRISIARAEQHRNIDISLETTAVSHDGRRHNRTPQIFTYPRTTDVFYI